MQPVQASIPPTSVCRRCIPTRHRCTGTHLPLPSVPHPRHKGQRRFFKPPSALSARQEELLARLNACSEKDRATALLLLEVFLESLNR